MLCVVLFVSLLGDRILCNESTLLLWGNKLLIKNTGGMIKVQKGRTEMTD